MSSERVVKLTIQASKCKSLEKFPNVMFPKYGIILTLALDY